MFMDVSSRTHFILPTRQKFHLVSTSFVHLVNPPFLLLNYFGNYLFLPIDGTHLASTALISWKGNNITLAVPHLGLKQIPGYRYLDSISGMKSKLAAICHFIMVNCLDRGQHTRSLVIRPRNGQNNAVSGDFVRSRVLREIVPISGYPASSFQAPE